jgi:hypothetical protein
VGGPVATPTLPGAITPGAVAPGAIAPGTPGAVASGTPGTPGVVPTGDPGAVAAPGTAQGVATPAAVAPPAASAVAAPQHWAVPAWLCGENAGTIVRNRGGSSITFRMRVASGGKFAFKPDQLSGTSRYRAELAAYRLSERLGYGRVPPSCERSFPSGTLANAAGADDEFLDRLRRELRVTDGGRVRGAAILWVDGIRSLEVYPGQVAGHALEPALSDMILFDELCGNWDRWSGGNVFADESGQNLVLIDNAAAFGPIGDERRARMDRVLDLARAPTPAMLDALARLTRDDVAAALAGTGYGDAVIDAVIARRDRMLGRRVSGAAAAR